MNETSTTEPGTARIPVTARQADWLADLAQSGSETMHAAMEAGAHLEDHHHLGHVLVVPAAAKRHLGVAVGMRADIADEGHYSIGERASVLGLARKLAANGISNAAPLVI